MKLLTISLLVVSINSYRRTSEEYFEMGNEKNKSENYRGAVVIK